MAERETNQFKRALHDALGVIDAQIALVEGEQGMGRSVVTKIAAHEGWVCAAADEWVAELTERCTPVMQEFRTARDEVQAEYDQQDDLVDADDPRGNRYSRSGRTNPGIY